MNNISIYFNIFKVPLPATDTVTLLWRGWRKGDAENTRDIVVTIRCTIYSYIYGMVLVVASVGAGSGPGAIWVPYRGGRMSHPHVAIRTMI